MHLQCFWCKLQFFWRHLFFHVTFKFGTQILPGNTNVIGLMLIGWWMSWISTHYKGAAQWMVADGGFSSRGSFGASLVVNKRFPIPYLGLDNQNTPLLLKRSSDPTLLTVRINFRGTWKRILIFYWVTWNLFVIFFCFDFCNVTPLSKRPWPQCVFWNVNK